MAWTTIAKPNTQTWTNVNPQGRQTYDQADITYDDASVYYDSVNLTTWTNVNTPSVAWNLSLATFKALYSVSTQTTQPEYAYFSPDGVYMFVGDGIGRNVVYKYTLSTPWDVSTKSVTSSQTFAALNYIEAIFFQEDGLKMYLLNNSTPDSVVEYSLATAWDITSTTLVASLNITAITGDTSHTGIYFKPDGTRMMVMGDTTDKIYEFRLPTPWEITSAVLNQSVSVAAQTSFPDGIYFKTDGTRLYISQYTNSSILYEYMLAEPWDIGTLAFNTSFTVSSTDLHLFSIFWRGNGLQMFVVTSLELGIREYTFPEAWTKVAKPT